MSTVKRKLKNTNLIQKCQIIREIEKGMANRRHQRSLVFQKIQYPRG